MFRSPVALLLLATALAAPAAAQTLAQTGNSRYIVLASRQNADEAIGIARSYDQAKVVRSVNGWYGVVVGPQYVANQAALKAKLVKEEDYPRDLVFSKGDNYTAIVWQPGKIEPLRKIEISGDVDSLSTSLDGLGVTLARTKPDADGQRIPFVTATMNGKPAFSVRLEEAAREQPFAAVELYRLDPASPLPQAIITGYTGGAHCCMAAVFATADAGGAWRTVAGQTLDGGGYWVEDADGDGQPELLHADNSFLYAFSSYAGSHPPRRIVRLAGAALQDVTREPRYQGYLRQEVARLEHLAQRMGDRIEINGHLAGWVAAKALVGEVDDAWATMLRRYDRSQTGMYHRCLIDQPLEQCPQDKQRPIGFPEALRQHLAKTGYPLPR